MADTKISALTAAGAAAAANEFPINEAGTSKKVTGTQLHELLANPVSDDGDALGTTALRWSDLFLAEGSVINWDNGDATITQAGDVLTVAGAGVVLAAGAATLAPLKLQAGTNLTTAEDGAIEMDADCIYGCTDPGNRGYIPVRHFIRADSTRTFTSNTNVQAIFNSPTNGRLTLETGTYLMSGVINIGSMSATSGNLLFNPLGGGTATMAAILYNVVGVDGATGTAATQTGSTMVAAASPASVVTAGTGTAITMNITGSFEITGAGTIIPSIQMVTAAASVVAIGSYLTFERIGPTSVVSVGQWD